MTINELRSQLSQFHLSRHSQEFVEVQWVQEHINHGKEDELWQQFAAVSDRKVRVKGVYYTVRWLRAYAYCRHYIRCMKVSTWFATHYSSHLVRERLDPDVDLALLAMNARLQRAERRKAQVPA